MTHISPFWRIYGSNYNKPLVTSAELSQDLHFSELLIRQIHQLVQVEPGLFSSLSSNDTDWSFTVSQSIRRFRKVETVEQYIEMRRSKPQKLGSDLQKLLIDGYLPAPGLPGQEDESTQGFDRLEYEIVEEPMEATNKPVQRMDPSTEIFIVHGHDEAAKEGVARFLEKLGLRPIILHEQANAGLTIIEKFERYSNVAFAVVLLTPDDKGAAKDSTHDLKPRARQNVILELGYFVGKLGRSAVCALHKGGVELPSDIQGVVYVDMDNAGAWKIALAREIKEAGLPIDMNKVYS